MSVLHFLRSIKVAVGNAPLRAPPQCGHSMEASTAQMQRYENGVTRCSCRTNGHHCRPAGACCTRVVSETFQHFTVTPRGSARKSNRRIWPSRAESCQAFPKPAYAVLKNCHMFPMAPKSLSKLSRNLPENRPNSTPNRPRSPLGAHLGPVLTQSSILNPRETA